MTIRLSLDQAQQKQSHLLSGFSIAAPGLGTDTSAIWEHLLRLPHVAKQEGVYQVASQRRPAQKESHGIPDVAMGRWPVPPEQATVELHAENGAQKPG